MRIGERRALRGIAVRAAKGEKEVVVVLAGRGDVTAHAPRTAEPGFLGDTLRGEVRLPNPQLDPVGIEFVEAPARNERDRSGRDAGVAPRGGDAVAQLDRLVLAHAQKDDADHLVRAGVGNDQRRTRVVFSLPAALEPVNVSLGVGAATWRRDRRPDRLANILVVAEAHERVDIARLGKPDDDRLVVQRRAG